MRQMMFAKQNLTSAEWLALGEFLFPVTSEQADRQGYDAREEPEYYCEACDQSFKTGGITPTVCPNCKATVDQQSQANTVTHVAYGHTVMGKVFPFFVPGMDARLTPPIALR